MKWRKPASDDILPGVSEETFLRAARDYVEVAFPNPDRVGCPGRSCLESLARREYAPAEAMQDINHVTTCSPCFIEYRAIRRSLRRKRTVMVAAVASTAMVAAVILGIVLVGHNRITVPAPLPTRQVEATQATARRETVDLRPFESLRGAAPIEPRQKAHSIHLTHENLLLTIQLPIGSEQGRYDFELIDSKGASQVRTSGEGVIRDYVTTVEAPFDLRSLYPGSFTLTVRRVSAHAVEAYPVEVR